MNASVIGALAIKDLSLYFRNRLFAVITIIGLVAYVVIYLIMPATVDETLEIGLYGTEIPSAFELARQEGLTLTTFESEAALREALTDGSLPAGIALPAGLLEGIAAGTRPRVKVYFASDTPEELKAPIEILTKELFYLEVGQQLSVEVTTEILGREMVGEQIPPRDRIVPLFAILLLLVETFGMASLISEEVERGTIRALLVTPLTITDLFIAKGIVGIVLAFGQAAIFVAIVGGLSSQPLLMLTALLLGALMVTGIGFLMASLSKDLMSVLAWGMVALIALSLPSMGILFPGTLTNWIELIPSFYLVDTLHRTANLGAGWAEAWRNLSVLLAFDVVVFFGGILALRRKFQ